MKIKWIGHSCFRLEQDGYVIVTDPYEDGSVPGLAPVRETADLVLCSHDHYDHNARNLITIREQAGGSASPFKVTKIDTWHDEVKGAKRGPNAIFLMEAGGLRIAHMGDLGCELTPGQKQELKGLDIMLVPVGGFFTIDGAQAAALAGEIGPKHIIPMHYRDDAIGFGFDVIAQVDAFAEAEKSVVRTGTSQIDTDSLPAEQVIILRPANAGAAR